MLSDDELLDRDASDSIFAKETPREDSPRTFTHHLINRFGISSKGGTETVINNTQSSNKLSRKCRQRYLKHLYKQSNHNINSCFNINCITCAKTYICNLSKRDLSDPQILLLSKGLSFVPTARDSNLFELLR